MGYKLAYGAAIHVGNIRANNEDNILILVGEDRTGEFGLFAVADGMGGLDAGEVASDAAIQELRVWWEQALPGLLPLCAKNTDALSQGLREVFSRINRLIISQASATLTRMGTTLSVLILYNGRYICSHIGDTRVYLLQNRSLNQVTRDHSWVAELVRMGLISDDQARTHPKRNLLTRCLGVTEQIQVETYNGRINSGDGFILCSDGFYNEANLAAVVQTMAVDSLDLQEVATSCVNSVLEGTAQDNVSLLMGTVISDGLFNRAGSLFGYVTEDTFR